MFAQTIEQMKQVRNTIVCSVFIVMMISVMPVFAQTFSAGFSGGLVASQVSGDRSGGFNKPGFYGGPWAAFMLNEVWQFRMEILYFQKGSRENPTEENGYYKYRLRLNYVEVPLLFRRPVSTAMTIEMGLGYSVLIKSYEELDDIEQNDRPFNTHNSSVFGGLSYQINDHWTAELRFSNSLTPIRKHKSGQTYLLNFGQTHSLISTGLSYRF